MKKLTTLFMTRISCHYYCKRNQESDNHKISTTEKPSHLHRKTEDMGSARILVDKQTNQDMGEKPGDEGPLWTRISLPIHVWLLFTCHLLAINMTGKYGGILL